MCFLHLDSTYHPQSLCWSSCHYESMSFVHSSFWQVHRPQKSNSLIVDQNLVLPQKNSSSNRICPCQDLRGIWFSFVRTALSVHCDTGPYCAWQRSAPCLGPLPWQRRPHDEALEWPITTRLRLPWCCFIWTCLLKRLSRLIRCSVWPKNWFQLLHV